MVERTVWFAPGATEEREEVKFPMQGNETGWVDMGLHDRDPSLYIRRVKTGNALRQLFVNVQVECMVIQRST